MKKLIVLSAVLSMFAVSANAASREILMAVLNSEETANVTDIETVEVKTERCPDCYTIVVSGTNSVHRDISKVEVKRVEGELIIKRVESSRGF